MTWLHYLAAFAAAAASGGAEPEPPAETPEAEILQMERERFERMTVPVTIMGQGPFRFMIDTGAQATVVSQALADRLQLLGREPAILVAMASSRPVETTMIPEFGLGSRTFTVLAAPLLDRAHIGGADGILGLDSLQDQRVLMDFSRGEISIVDAEEASNRGYEIVVRARERLGQLIIHRAKVDGVTVAVIVDTGAQGSIGNPALQARLRRAGRAEDATFTDVNGVQATGAVRIVDRLEVGRMELGNVAITFTDSPTFRALGLDDRPAMVLGMSELRVFKRVAIDFRTARILFDIPTDSATQNAFLFDRPRQQGQSLSLPPRR